MKKQFKILLAIILTCLFIGISFGKADYSVTVGTVNIYDVNVSEWDYTAGTGTSHGEGFRFEDQKFSLDDQISITVDYWEVGFVEYTVDVGTESVVFTATPLLLLGIYFLQLYPFIIAVGIENYVQTEAYLGLGLQGLYFIEPNTAENYFTQVADEMFQETEFINDECFTFNNVDGTFNTDSNIAVFTWTLDALYFDEEDGTDYGGEYSFTLSYDQTTGELIGYRFDFHYEGTYEFKTVDLEHHQEVVMHGYNLQGDSVAGFSWFITIPTLAIIGVLSVVSYKRKKM